MLRYLAALIFLVLYMILGLLLYPCYLLNKKFFGKLIIRNCYRIVLWICGVKVVVEGLENIDENAKYLIVSNHQSAFDIPVIGAALPLNMRIFAKKELSRIPFFGQMLLLYDFVFVNRKKRREALKDLKKASRKLRRCSFLIFPEGTRSKDGSVGKFKSGGLSIAYENNNKILPLALYGVDKIMKPGTLTINKGVVDLKIFKPVEISKNETRQDLAAKLQLQIADFVDSKNSIPQ